MVAGPRCVPQLKAEILAGSHAGGKSSSGDGGADGSRGAGSTPGTRTCSMALSIIRFDMRPTALEPKEAQRLYEAALEMGEWADARGFDMLTLSEHHASPDGYLPSPLVLGGAMAARTKQIALWISALLLPLHDPIRLAEDLAVLDLISGGRVSMVTGLGYRPIEYELLG